MLTYRQYHTLLEETDAVNTIISVAELLRSEAEDEGDAKTSMNSFLNMLRNAGLNIDYDGLKAYYDAEPRLQSEIQDFNEKEVVFVGDAEGLDMKPSGEMPPEKKVNSMAKKALAKRESVNEMIDREIKNGKMYISRADFKKVSKDYKNDTPGEERMLGLDPETGGTTSYEVVFTDLGPGKEFRGTADDIMMKMKAYKKATDKLGIGEDNAGRKEDMAQKEYLEKLLAQLEGKSKKSPGDGFAKMKIRELLVDLTDRLAYESVNEISQTQTPMRDKFTKGSAFGGTIDKMQYILHTKSAMEIDCVLVDTFTDSLIMDIFNKVKKDNQDKMRKMPVEKLVSAAYKLADRVKEDVELGEAISSVEKWWSQSPEDLMSTVYHARGQVPPSDKEAYTKSLKSIVNQLNKKYPAPEKELEKFMKEEVGEGYYEMPPMDKDKYQERDGLEGPFQTRSGKVVYYDPKEGSYYDPDSDIYMSYDEFMAYDKSKPEDFKITKMELPKKESVEESFDYWQSPDSIAKLAGVKKK